jgi:hypothetical protein
MSTPWVVVRLRMADSYTGVAIAALVAFLEMLYADEVQTIPGRLRMWS